MDWLAEVEIREFGAFLATIYALHDPESFAEGLVLALPRLIPAEVVGYMAIVPDGPGCTIWMNPAALNTAEHRRRWEEHVRTSPLMAFYRETQEMRAYAISRILSREQFRALPAYHEIYRPTGREDCMAFLAPAGPSLAVGVSVGRGSWGFSDRELLLMNMLARHVVRARENAVEMARLGERRSRSEAELGLRTETVLLSATGEVTSASPRGREQLTTYGGPRSSVGDRLPERVERWLRAQQAIAPPGERQPLVLERPEGRLVIRFVDGWTAKMLILEEQSEALSQAALAELGLTPREAEVLVWIAAGKTNAEIAVIFGLSVRTVDKHVERIRDKHHVENRTAAAAELRQRFAIARR